MAKNKDMTQSPHWLKQRLDCETARVDKLKKALADIYSTRLNDNTSAIEKLSKIYSLAYDALELNYEDEWES